jgi:hypothetical protein
MKTNLKKMLGLAALGLTLLANTVPTWAGSVSTPEVYIGTNGNGIPFASGSMVGARYSADGQQYIGCSASFHSILSVPIMNCFAVKSSKEQLFCSSVAPKHLEAVQAMTDSSYIYFEVDRADPVRPRCVGIAITDSSGLLK